MNKYVRMAIEVPTGIIKSVWLNVLHYKKVSISPVCAVAPSAEFTIDKGAVVRICKKFRMRGGVRIRVRKDAEVTIDENTSISHNCMIVCREKIEIGKDVQISPNVMIYDHDHDYKTLHGVRDMKYRTSSIIIGNNVWIGVNTVILRGTTLGDDCVVGAGCVVKGEYPAGVVIVQKRTTEILGGGYCTSKNSPIARASLRGCVA